MKIEGSGSASGTASESGSESETISQRHGSADPDPDPHQNIMVPQHCVRGWETYLRTLTKDRVQVPTRDEIY
jgi:hypothetical protein